ncbi:hypothetical protein Anapl_06602 [Anas platyrhynchos]|uniref:Uncharacterized protein n=1 Tax=Anas platyrhynchos TaxID=8839 RepID=R0LUK8_ANAPL|nr:hypothetical protein Anapl_06602 [Anas platyrhynchos]
MAKDEPKEPGEDGNVSHIAGNAMPDKERVEKEGTLPDGTAAAHCQCSSVQKVSPYPYGEIHLCTVQNKHMLICQDTERKPTEINTCPDGNTQCVYSWEAPLGNSNSWKDHGPDMLLLFPGQWKAAECVQGIMRLISDGDRQLPIHTVITARQQVEKDTQTVPLCVLQMPAGRQQPCCASFPAKDAARQHAALDAPSASIPVPSFPAATIPRFLTTETFCFYIQLFNNLVVNAYQLSHMSRSSGRHGLSFELPRTLTHEELGAEAPTPLSPPHLCCQAPDGEKHFMDLTKNLCFEWLLGCAQCQEPSHSQLHNHEILPVKTTPTTLLQEDNPRG